MFTESQIYKITQQEYDKAAQEFSQTRPYFWKDLAFIKRYIKKKSKLLDFGCGNGRLLEILEDKQVDYLGVDVSKKLLKIAKKKYPKHQFQLINPDPSKEKYNLFSDENQNSFDIIVSIGVFHHFPKGKWREKFLKGLSKILKPKGILILTVWNLKETKYWKELKKKAGFVTFKNGDKKVLLKRYLYHWTKTEFKNFIKSNKNNSGLNLKILKIDFSYRNKKPVNLYCISQKT
jgi:cyclopropane fatty-acyl-phospholipid synthase-like methyltransferase